MKYNRSNFTATEKTAFYVLLDLFAFYLCGFFIFIKIKRPRSTKALILKYAFRHFKYYKTLILCHSIGSNESLSATGEAAVSVLLRNIPVTVMNASDTNRQF